MLRCACVMMQKDEDLLLEPWLRYHGELFGYENLFVYDNGSERSDVRAQLSAFERRGVTVDRSHATPSDFDRKGEVVAERIREFQTASSYDVVFPLDCDEFVATLSPDGFSCRVDDIRSSIVDEPFLGSIVTVGHCLDNRPGFDDLFRLTPFNKCIVPVSGFDGIDHGFHQARLTRDAPHQLSRIIYVHMHFKPFDVLRRHAIDKLAPFVDTADPSAVRSFTGVGKHLVRYLTTTSDSYYFDVVDYRYPFVAFSGFARRLSELIAYPAFKTAWCGGPAWLAPSRLGRDIVSLSSDFSASGYLAANPDVAKSGMEPVIHYCLFGFREGRPFTPPDAFDMDCDNASMSQS